MNEHSARRLRSAAHHLAPHAAAVEEPLERAALQGGGRSHGPESDPPGSDRFGLSGEEVDFFKQFGYIVKRKLIPEADLTPWRQKFWDTIVPADIKRDDTDSYVDPQRHDGWGPSPEVIAESKAAGRTNRAYPVSFGSHVVSWTQIGGNPAFVQATCAHPRVLRMVESLVGGPIKKPHRNRGTYVHFPRSSDKGSLGPHNDTMPAELFGMVYLDDVPPKSGGTTIWPTSPQQLWECLDTEHNCGFNPNERYARTFQHILDTVEPVEFVGGVGDVMFLHPAMIHSAGINTVAHGAGTLRIATVMEWQRARPAGAKRTLWWTLNDSSRAVSRGPRDRLEYNTRARPDGTFAPAMDGRDPASEADHEVQLVWHHDAAEYMPCVPTLCSPAGATILRTCAALYLFDYTCRCCVRQVQPAS